MSPEHKLYSKEKPNYATTYISQQIYTSKPETGKSEPSQQSCSKLSKYTKHLKSSTNKHHQLVNLQKHLKAEPLQPLHQQHP
jgi:hypothetical protein